MGIVPGNDDSEYSPTWKWVDNEELVGTHVEFRKAGDTGGVVWEIKRKHGPVSVWVEPFHLKKKLSHELAKRKRDRGVAQLDPGEKVRINPGTKRPSKSNPGQSVWPFPTFELEHGIPDPTAEELLLASADVEDDADEADETEPEAEPEGGDPDDLPF